MGERSHIDTSKIEKVPSGHPFEYKDVVQDNYPAEEHTEDGKRFKEEVLSGTYSNVFIDKDTGSHLLYRKK